MRIKLQAMDHKGLTHWKTESLEKSMDAIIDYRGKTPKKTNLGIPLITAKIVKNGVIEQPSEFIAVADYDSWMVRGLPEVGDVVITTEAPLGEVAQLASKNVALAQRIVTLRGKKDFLHNDFLLYLLQSNNIKRQLESRSSGSTVKGIKQKELRKIELLIPPYQEQISISNILKKLDQKIELNRQINQTLEAMAQALFKSWFVDFDPVKAKLAAKAAGADAEGVTLAAMEALSGQNAEALRKLAHTEPERYAELKATAALFPEALVASELGEIPAGWEVVLLKGIAEKISKGTTPSKKQLSEANDCEKIKFIKVKDISDNGEILADNISEIPESIHINALKRSILNQNDILFSIAGTIGRISFVNESFHNSNINQAVAFIRLKKQEFFHLVYEHLKSKRVQDNIQASIVQGVQANVSLTSLGLVTILSPDSNVLKSWNSLINPIKKKLSANRQETSYLTELRDTLLPKLLSGEISVDDVELPS